MKTFFQVDKYLFKINIKGIMATVCINSWIWKDNYVVVWKEPCNQKASKSKIDNKDTWS